MAAQPPRPPPNNLLFTGPPPALPRVVLLPSDIVCDASILQWTPDATACHMSDADTLHEINNIGVPTNEVLFTNQVEKSDLENIDEHPVISENYLRRTHSFDISDIYNARLETDIDARAFQHRRSEPDLSKYGLFVEAEVTVECAPSLVLNNPFYDGSYAMDPTQLNQTIVMLPENYLAFEDSFVPTYNNKPELAIDTELVPEYYDDLPLIPINDPWSVYGNENAAFEYYSPRYEISDGEPDVRYLPLTDLEYAIPQYMSLPQVEEARLENIPASKSEEIVSPNIGSVSEKTEDLDKSSLVESRSSPVVSNVNSENVSAINSSTNKESSIQSEGSLNADISNDITSSLAFIPNSKSSIRPHDADATSDDTSPCSTDYQEASALDLVQSSEDLSSCDSTDFSQSRDDTSPSIAEHNIQTVFTSETTKDRNERNGPYDLVSNKTLANLPLNQLPAIPHHDRIPNQLPSPPKVNPDKPLDTIVPNERNSVSQELNVNTRAKDESIVSQISEPTLSSKDIWATPVTASDSNTVNTSLPKPPQRPVCPPAVPPAWLTFKPPIDDCTKSSVKQALQICVQNTEGFMTQHLPQPPVTKENQPSEQEPQPSCSFVSTQPAAQASQLKPQKEVEVSQ